jgi:NAD-dependent DNA ligase
MKNFATFKEIILIGNNMTGMKVVLSGFRNKKLEEDIIARGGKVTTSVSGNTSVLVLASTAGKPSGKTIKALELGIEVLNMEEFMIKYIT